MPPEEAIAARVRDRFPAANVTVAPSPKGWRIIVSEPGHRTVGADMAPEMVDTGIHLLWINRRELDRHAEPVAWWSRFRRRRPRRDGLLLPGATL